MSGAAQKALCSVDGSQHEGAVEAIILDTEHAGRVTFGMCQRHRTLFEQEVDEYFPPFRLAPQPDDPSVMRRQLRRAAIHCMSMDREMELLCSLIEDGCHHLRSTATALATDRVSTTETINTIRAIAFRLEEAQRAIERRHERRTPRRRVPRPPPP